MSARAAIPGVDAPLSTNLAVMAPAAAGLRQAAGRDRWEGGRQFRLEAWHGFVLFAIFVFALGAAEAQSGSDPNRSPIATLIRWIPVVLWANGNGFVLNLVISFLAMAIGTVAGAALGLGQISIYKPVRIVCWSVTQFFRNSPWLVLLFCIMLLFPFEVRIFGEIYSIPAWVKATIGFSLPVMANLSEVVRGAVQSIDTGQWESSEALAFTRMQQLWMIILPQCFKRMIPPWMNWYAILTMATPLCSIMGVEEAVNLSQQAMAAEDSRPELLAPFYTFLMLVFFIYCYPIARWTIYLERKYTVKI